MKSKGLIIGGIILLVIIIVFGYSISSYNGLVTAQQTVENSWGQVENQYQRRMDLIPNLVSTVKGYAKHEKETLEGVIQARASASQIKIDPANMTEADLQRFQQAQGDLTQALSKLMVLKENYPELKADRQFLTLQAQIEGTENRIAIARKDFNDAAKEYNLNVLRFPKNIFAGIFGFQKRPYFEADKSAHTAPKIEF